MALPAAIQLCTVHFGPFTDFTGKVYTGSVTFKPSTSLVWIATGQPLIGDALTADLNLSGSSSIELPYTNQTGFGDGLGNSVTNWTYEVSYRIDGSSTTIATRHIQLPLGSSNVDLDLTTPTTGSSGVTVDLPAVISVAGLTGVISASALNTALGGGGGGGGPISVPGDITATGTPSATTFLRGDGAWAVPAASTVAWTAITGKPAAFTPETHSHSVSDIGASGTPNSSTYLRGDGTWAAPANASSWVEITGKPATFPPDAHTHALSDVAGLSDWNNITNRPAMVVPVFCPGDVMVTRPAVPAGSQVVWHKATPPTVGGTGAVARDAWRVWDGV